jgi:formylglycine-generating enzyme required for sulfatase activity
MTLTRDSTLTWQWLTEHRVVTATSGNGTISTPTGWHPAGMPLQITATPATGYHFSGWSGDVSGCTLGGRNIVIPMNGPRAAITANFTTNENFTIVALPDTQNYTSISSPTDTFTRQTQWVLDNKSALNIKFLTHLGDIVNSPTNTSQWTRATNAMNLLNAQLAYGTCPGNHDIGSRDNPGSTTASDYLIRFGPNPTHASSVGRWIDPADSQTYDWYRGSSPRGYSSYQIVPINGQDFMFLHLDHDCPDEDMAWAASVLSSHPQTLTMITTHNYLAETGGTGFFGTGTGERGYTAQPNVSIGPDRNKPQEVFDTLVKPFNQVYMVICGHMFAIYNLEKTNNAGNTVHEVLCDYQSLPNGGNGFLRIMEFRPAENKIYNSSFSPTLGRYIDPALPADRQGMLDLHNPNGGEFVLDTDFDTRFDSTLTVASAYASVSPSVGTHDITAGTAFVVSATDQTVGQTRYKPVGWTLTGAQNTSGTGSSAVLTQAGDSTLTWSWATEYFLQTAATGDGIVSISSGWQTSGANVTVVAQPDPGATFTTWSGDIVGCTVSGASISVPMDRSRGPITAQFSSSVPIFLVEVVSPYASTTPAPATYSYEENSSITFSAEDLTTGTTRRVCTGYTVTGGITSNGTTNTVTLPITGNATLTWLWKTQYQVTAVASGPGTVAPAAAWIDADSPLTLTGTPGSGANLVSWTGDISGGSGSGTSFSIPSVNRPMGPITANFALGTHILTVVSSEGTVTPAVGTLVLQHGSVVTFEALPNVTSVTRAVPTGWVLTGSNPGSGSTTSGSFVLDSDATLTWSWSPEVYLAISSGFEGKVTPFDAEGWKPLNAQVTLTAAPATGYHFVKWNGDVPANSTQPAITLTMSQPRQVTADASPAATTSGTPHWWLDTHANVVGGDYEAAALADSDGDGQSAAAEFAAGTDDLDGSRRFQVTPLIPGAGQNLQLTWQSDILRDYYIRSSPDLSSTFTELVGPIPGQWPTTSTTVPPVGSHHFFKIESRLPLSSALDADSFALSPEPAPSSMLRQMRRIPAGWFTQGDNGGVQDTKPSHPAWVPGFDMDRFEVTRADWEMVATWASTHGYDIPIAQQYIVTINKPAVAISWYNAVKWCNARSEMEGRIPVYHADTTGATIYRTGQIDLTTAHVNWSGNGYRLPTESEWERASRGGIENQPYPWGGANADFRANHWNYELYLGVAPSQDFPYLMPVGSFNGTQSGETFDTVNAYGLYDMVGNAWEWTWDRMNTYTADSKINSRGPNTGAFRVQRGGSWWNYIDQATNFQRLAFPPNGTDDYGMNGFRCVRGLHPNE